AEAAADSAAEYLALEATAQAGPALDQFRSQTRPEHGLSLRVFGMRRLGTTRDYLGERAAAALCRQVVGLWTATPSIHDGGAAVDLQAERLAASLALDATGLQNRLAAGLDGGDPLARLEPELIRSLEDFSVKPEGTVPSGAAEQVLIRLEAFFGIASPAASDCVGGEASASLAGALRTHGGEQISQTCQSIAQWILQLVDSPGERLAAAERAAEWFARYVEEQIQVLKRRLETVRRQSVRIKARFLQDAEAPTRMLTGCFGRGRRRDTPATATNPLADYCRSRLEELTLEQAQALLAEVG